MQQQLAAYANNVKRRRWRDVSRKGVVGLTGSATVAAYVASFGEGTASRVDAANQSYVEFAVVSGRIYEMDILNTHATNGLSVRPLSLGAAFFSVAAGVRSTTQFTASSASIRVCATTDGQTTSFSIRRFREVPS